MTRRGQGLNILKKYFRGSNTLKDPSTCEEQRTGEWGPSTVNRRGWGRRARGGPQHPMVDLAGHIVGDHGGFKKDMI